MNLLPLACALFLALVCLTRPACASLWDRDTAELARARTPPLWNAVAGLRARLPDDVLETRVADTRTRLAAGPYRPALADDLAVALLRLGRIAEAVEVLTDSDRRVPGRFETLANLGTALLAHGQAEEGMDALRRALRVNSRPPFGREPAELLLAEYRAWSSRSGNADSSFADFLPTRDPSSVPPAEALIHGLSQMLLISGHDDVLPLEALGHLTLKKALADPKGEATWLPARAFLRAAALSSDPAARARFRGLAKDALSRQTRISLLTGKISLHALEIQFEREIALAELKNKQWQSADSSSGGEPDRLFIELNNLAFDAPEQNGWISFERMFPRAVFWILVSIGGFIALRRWIGRATSAYNRRLASARERFALNPVPDDTTADR